MWWNAALDHGEDDVLWGMPGRVPERLGLASLGACALGVALASAAHALAGAALLLASLLSLLYSHPRIALKGHPVGGPLVNLLGYGILAPLSGWCLADLPLTPRLGLALTFLSCVVLGLYFGAQAFQGEEDRRRGHRTLVVTQGPRVAVRAARMLLVASLVVLALACLAGFFPRLCLLGLLALPALDRHMREWERAPGGGTRRHAEGMLTASLVVAVLLVGLATLDWRLDLRAGGPVAGLATARGRPGPLP
jgi:1,4-dihydroxy-2-naphthoate octaprenyltransferase